MGLIIGTLIFFFAPGLYHNYLLSNTTEAEIIINRTKYNELAMHVSKNPYTVEKTKLAIKDSLYLWFHVRGLDIDEDHYPITTTERWKEIFRSKINN